MWFATKCHVLQGELGKMCLEFNHFQDNVYCEITKHEKKGFQLDLTKG